MARCWLRVLLVVFMSLFLRCRCDSEDGPVLVAGPPGCLHAVVPPL